MRERKRSGQRLNLSASDWNAAMEAADMLLGGKLNRRDNTLSVPRGNQDVLGKNTTGQTLPAFSVVGLSDTVTPTPSANLVEWKQQNHEFECVIPETPKHFGKWGITQEPLVANAVGRIRIAGIAIAHVSGTPPDDDWSEDPFPYFVECVDNQTSTLEIRYRGAAQVIWKDPGSDWAIIRFGTAWRPNAIRASLVDGNDFEQETASDPHTAGTIVGIDDVWFGENEIDVYNPLKIKLWEGCDVVAHWNATAEQWEVIAATSDKVMHGTRRKDCEFNKLDGAEGWHEWDEGSEAEWVTSVYEEDCELKYDTDCSPGQGIVSLDFVKDVVVSASSCVITVFKHCENEVIDYELNFVQSVSISGSALIYSTCSGDVLIASLGPCDPPAPCGSITYEAQDNEGLLEWVIVAGECESPCVDPDPPTEEPTIEGQQITLPCVE
jgi:hypothetical protein